MADREVNKGCTIYADLPGLTNETVTLALYDANNVLVLDGNETTGDGAGRYTCSIPETALTTSGIYEAQWVDADNEVLRYQRFTVGPRPLSGITRYQLRNQCAARVDRVIRGQVTSATEASISDDTLLGGAGNYKGWWVIPGPLTAESGRYRRVIEFSGTGMTLSSPFPTTLGTGDAYTLTRLDPYEIDEAIEVAFSDLTGSGRVQVSVSGIIATDNVISVPVGLTHVSEVYVDDERVDGADWTMLPGRRIEISEDVETDGVDIVVAGIRPVEIPQFEDSIIEIDPVVVVARVAHILHTTRAAGPAADQKEHLRRQLTAFEEFERMTKRGSGRINPNTKRVIE